MATTQRDEQTRAVKMPRKSDRPSLSEDRVVADEEHIVPANCVIAPMHILDTPEGIKTSPANGPQAN